MIATETTQIRLAKFDDIPDIKQLNKRWLTSDINSINKTNGFLFGDPLKSNDLELIILHKELVVATHKESIIGYYLFDNFSDTDILRQYSKYIEELRENGLLERSERISKRAQAVIESKFQNLGLSKKLLSLLINETKGKYDLLFSVVSKLNPKIIAHQKAGWQIISENESLYFVTYDLSRNLQQLRG